jgi:hypothetical protein
LIWYIFSSEDIIVGAIMDELKNNIDQEIISLRQSETHPQAFSEEVDISLPPPDDDKDIEYGLRLLSAHRFEWKSVGESHQSEEIQKKMVAACVIFGLAVLLLLLLWFIVSIMPRKGRNAAVSHLSYIERIG